jgi:hypothetical protein
MSEKTEVENKVRKWAELNGWYCWKITPMGKRGFPDHLFFKRFPCLVIIEFKAPGKRVKSGSLQEYVITILLRLGWPVYVVNDPEIGKQILRDLEEKYSERILGS